MRTGTDAPVPADHHREFRVDRWVNFGHDPAESVPRVTSAGLGPEADQASREWIENLRAASPEPEEARARLHDWLLALARIEAHRRSSPAYAGDDQGTLAGQAAATAHGQISRDLDSFGGDSRFTIWAGKFVIYAMTAAAGRRFWHGRSWPDQHQDWDQLPGAAAQLAEPGEANDLVRALRQAVEQDLTVKQRSVFTAVVFGDLPPEALAAGLGPGRNAIYQALFEARRKLGARLASGTPGTGARWLDAMLAADPGDTGCDLAFRALDKYAEADLAGTRPERRFPGVAVHLASCAPCHQDYQGLLAAARR